MTPSARVDLPRRLQQNAAPSSATEGFDESGFALAPEYELNVGWARATGIGESQSTTIRIDLAKARRAIERLAETQRDIEADERDSCA